MCLCAFHSILKLHTLASLGHHALKCVIGGPRVEYHAPLSLKHDREGGGANIALKKHCHALFVLCCWQNRFLQEDMAGRPSTVPIDQTFVADINIHGRWMADGLYFWPVTFHSAQEEVQSSSGNFHNFQSSKAV